jgi:hypothetical protein
LVQVDYARVVHLDIGASKSDICTIRVGHHFEARQQNSSLQPRIGVEAAMENVEPTGRPATDRQRTTPRSGFESFPRYAFPLFSTPICAIAVVLSAMPYSIEASKTAGIIIAANTAQAVIGRPLTPGSVAGVARRTARRHHYYGHYGHHHCVWVVVSGARVRR